MASSNPATTNSVFFIGVFLGSYFGFAGRSKDLQDWELSGCNLLSLIVMVHGSRGPPVKTVQQKLRRGYETPKGPLKDLFPYHPPLDGAVLYTRAGNIVKR